MLCLFLAFLQLPKHLTGQRESSLVSTVNQPRSPICVTYIPAQRTKTKAGTRQLPSGRKTRRRTVCGDWSGWKEKKKKNFISSRDILDDWGRFRSQRSHCCRSVKKSFQPLSSFARRRLQGEHGTGESAYRPVKPQELASWRLLVNTTGSGSWHPPAGPVCEHDFPLAASLSRVS